MVKDTPWKMTSTTPAIPTHIPNSFCTVNRSPSSAAANRMVMGDCSWVITDVTPAVVKRRPRP